jgi:protein O-GlcNAc transferase
MAGWFPVRQGKSNTTRKFNGDIVVVPPSMSTASAERRLASARLALRLFPRSANYLNNQAWALLDLGRFDESIAAADKAITIAPSYFWPWNNKGVALAGLKRYEEALACYEQAIALKPRHFKIWRNKAYALQSLERSGDALEAAEISIGLDRNDMFTRRILARTLRTLKRYDEALAWLEFVISRVPTHSAAWADMAAIFAFALVQYENAIVCCNEALARDPAYPYALNAKSIA